MTSRLGTGKSLTFFYSVHSVSAQSLSAHAERDSVYTETAWNKILLILTISAEQNSASLIKRRDNINCQYRDQILWN